MAKTMKQKYAGYAIQKTRETRDRAADEVQRLVEQGRPAEEIERAEARLASWNDVVDTYEDAKKWLAYAEARQREAQA